VLKVDEFKCAGGSAIVDLIGNGGHIGTVPIRQWAKAALDLWITTAGATHGRIFRHLRAHREGVRGKYLAECRLVRGQDLLRKTGLLYIAPHDLRRTCANLCHSSGGENEESQFLQAVPRTSRKRPLSSAGECCGPRQFRACAVEGVPANASGAPVPDQRAFLATYGNAHLSCSENRALARDQIQRSTHPHGFLFRVDSIRDAESDISATINGVWRPQNYSVHGACSR